VVLQVLNQLELSIPFITVITDMSDFHKGWMAKDADIVVVPSIDARKYCIDHGLDPRRVYITGLPVDPRFTGPLKPEARRALRERLGLRDAPTLLMLSGGEGSGRLGKHAIALDRAELGIQLVVVCGRNEKLRRKLAAYPWKGAVQVHGFVQNMPDLMHAADAVVTKAGPGTIAEALISALPMFLTSYVPGQEEGNVKFVLDEEVGWYTPRARKLLKAVRGAFGSGQQELQRMRGRAEKVGRAGAASEIAQLITATVPTEPDHPR
jgi:1,2-diacylglycerol 3-beta-galactosyltransferase